MSEVQRRQMIRMVLIQQNYSRATLERLKREAEEAGASLHASVVADLLAEGRVASGVPRGRMSGSRRFTSKGE